MSIARFRLDGEIPKEVRRWLTAALRTRAFEGIDPKGDEDSASGFVELEDNAVTEFAPGTVFIEGHALFAWKVEKLRISASELRNDMKAWSDKFENDNGRSAGRKEKTAAKEAIRHKLRSKTEPSSKVFDISLNLKTQDVHIWGTTRSVVDEVTEAMESTLKQRLLARVPAAFAKPAVVDNLSPSPELHVEGL